MRLLALVGFVGLSLLTLAAEMGFGAGWPLAGWAWTPLWAGLHGAVGVAAWLVWRRVDVGLERKRGALRIWGWLLLLSGLWTAAFFGAQSPAAAIAVMAALVGALVLTVRAFLQLQRWAALLMAPYALWLCWAAYMNACCFWSGST